MSRYQDGRYQRQCPDWHAEDSPLKLRWILDMMRRNDLRPDTVCEVGCGAGAIVEGLHRELDGGAVFEGWEISPQAYEIARRKERDRLTFHLDDFLSSDGHYDLILLIDVIEHVEDCFGFMRQIKGRSTLKLLHIPLDLTASAALRARPLAEAWRDVGHVHLFNRSLVECFFEDVGHEIVDWFYTWGGLRFPRRPLAALAWLPRALLSRTAPDLATRTIGGASMMVLVR